MGDVFNAMNRDKDRHGQQPADEAGVDAAPQGSSASSSDGAAGETPDQSVTEAMRKAQADRAAERPAHVTGAELDAMAAKAAPPPPPSTTVADAQTRAQDERVQHAVDAARAAAHGGGDVSDPSLNGYAREVVVHHDRGSVITEQYRAIRTQVLARSRNRKVQLHVITSSVHAEGKSVTTVNLGMTFAELRDQRTLLVEGDLRKPSFPHLFDRDCPKGLLHFLRGEVNDIASIAYPTVYDNLQFVPAGGHSTDQSTELLSSPRMIQLLELAKDQYDHIFIDSPPVLTVTDACILGAVADQTMLVVRMNRTPSEAVDRCKRLLKAANCDVAGVILTHLNKEAPGYYYRYDRYRYAGKRYK